MKWFTGGTSEYRAGSFGSWMPGDYAGEGQQPQRKRPTLKQQLKMFARAHRGRYGS